MRASLSSSFAVALAAMTAAATDRYVSSDGSYGSDVEGAVMQTKKKDDLPTAEATLLSVFMPLSYQIAQTAATATVLKMHCCNV